MKAVFFLLVIMVSACAHRQDVKQPAPKEEDMSSEMFRTMVRSGNALLRAESYHLPAEERFLLAYRNCVSRMCTAVLGVVTDTNRKLYNCYRVFLYDFIKSTERKKFLLRKSCPEIIINEAEGITETASSSVGN